MKKRYLIQKISTGEYYWGSGIATGSMWNTYGNKARPFKTYEEAELFIVDHVKEMCTIIPVYTY